MKKFVVLGSIIMTPIVVMAVLLGSDAMHRGRQKQTMGDIRTIATGVESWSIDHPDRYPVVGSLGASAPPAAPTVRQACQTAAGPSRSVGTRRGHVDCAS